MTICPDCKKQCKVLEDYIEFPATHCNFGLAGKHYLGTFYSDCCTAEIEEHQMPYEMEDER